MTVSWRRSASVRGTDLGAGSGGMRMGACSSPIARSILRRCPSRTPRSLRSCSVRSETTERSMAFSEKRWAYSPKPIEANHSAIPVMANLWPAHATITRTGHAKAYQSAQPPVGEDRHAHRTSSGLHSSSPFERISGVRLGWRAHEGRSARSGACAVRGGIAEDGPARDRGELLYLKSRFRSECSARQHDLD